MWLVVEKLNFDFTFLFYILNIGPNITVGPGIYIHIYYSKTSKDNYQMILITSFFKSFDFELNPIPKTDFLKIKIWHEIFNLILSP